MFDSYFNLTSTEWFQDGSPQEILVCFLPDIVCAVCLVEVELLVVALIRVLIAVVVVVLTSVEDHLFIGLVSIWCELFNMTITFTLNPLTRTPLTVG